jgi:hypothetical protein
MTFVRDGMCVKVLAGIVGSLRGNFAFGIAVTTGTALTGSTL